MMAIKTAGVLGLAALIAGAAAGQQPCPHLVPMQGAVPAGLWGETTSGAPISPDQTQHFLENLAGICGGGCPAATKLVYDENQVLICVPDTSGTVTSVALSAPSGWTIGGSPITGHGTLSIAPPAATTSQSGVVQLEVDGGTTAGRAVDGSDARLALAATSIQPGNAALTDARTPLAHTHPTTDITGGGPFAPARLGTGTPTATTLLHGDGSWSDLTGTFGIAITGNAGTASSFDHTPAACPSGQFASAQSASGALTCGTPAGGGGSPAFDPLSLTGLRAWVRVTDAQAVDGDPVDHLWDRSGRARPFAATGTDRPVLVGGAVPNGRAGVRFDGASQFMQGAAAGSAVADATSWSFAVVFEATAAVPCVSTTYSNPAVVAHEGLFFGLFVCDNSGTVECRAYNWHGGDQSVHVACALGAWHLAVVRSSGGTLGLSIDGGTESTVASGTTDDVSNHLRIGSPGTTSAGLYVAELVMASPAPSFADLITYELAFYGL